MGKEGKSHGACAMGEREWGERNIHLDSGTAFLQAGKELPDSIEYYEIN